MVSNQPRWNEAAFEAEVYAASGQEVKKLVPATTFCQKVLRRSGRCCGANIFASVKNGTFERRPIVFGRQVDATEVSVVVVIVAVVVVMLSGNFCNKLRKQLAD